MFPTARVFVRPGLFMAVLATVTIPAIATAQSLGVRATASHRFVLPTLAPHELSLIVAEPDSSPGSLNVSAQRAINAREDRLQASVLLGFGLGSIAGGAYAAIAGLDNNRLLSASLNTVAWGAINTLIAWKWLAGTYSEERAAEHDRALVGDAAEHARTEAIARSESQARSLIINALLDVVYIGGGTALVLAADNVSGFGANDFWAGVGLGALTQGAFLLGFDAIGYFAARHRTDALRHATLPHPPAHEKPVAP